MPTPSATAPCPAVILAGGRGRRMGGADKALVHLDGRPLLDHVLDRLTPQAGPIAVNANGPADRFAAFGLPVLPDSVPGWPGPLAGILAALDWAASLGAARVVTVAADTPFFPNDLVARLASASEAAGGALALAATADAAGGQARHPTFGLWPCALQDALRAGLGAGDRKVTAWADRHGAVSALFDAPSGADPFFNINTPEDLTQAAAICVRE